MDFSTILTNPLVILALIFVDGLLFGLGIKKGVWSVLLIVLAVLLSEYINYSVIPSASLSSFETNIQNHITYIVQNLQTLIPGGSTTSISASLMLFAVGFIIGYLKG
ncbi:MAG: hypothetical protein M1414_04825 [Candidatus Thermoplasmatota archaeon]|jgi:hypothetical protein|nr:hypothetical protein [Candidatus Thermoplasmatota archaeon]MCL5988211.1 hypothetical protein [Candidatus Thermoplasmatota archaeon]